MIFSTIISLYTSRLVLNTLGESDYGIFSLVGGIIVLFSVINKSMSGATSRFLTYEMGKNNPPKLKETFSSALIVHIIIAILVLILGETIGLWIVNYKLTIPSDRILAANIVFQCSILSSMIGITQTPYNASIISHEKMDIFAYIEILNTTLKLLIVYLLLICQSDKLILYACLTLSVSITTALIYRIYCIKKFPECHLTKSVSYSTIRPMINFSMWDLYGNLCVTSRQQGIAIMINRFFGTIMNATAGIANIVQGTIAGFCFNVITAFRPQIIKCYSVNDISNMTNLMFKAIKFSLILQLMISIPIIIELDRVFTIWLGKIPNKSVEICQIIIIGNIPIIINSIINIAIHATGKIKQLSFQSGSIILLSLIPTYIILKHFCVVQNIYYIYLLANVLVLFSGTIILKHHIPMFSIKPFYIVIIKILASCIPLYVILALLRGCLNFNTIIITPIISILYYAIYTYLFVIDIEGKILIKRKILNLMTYR